ncbi:MAG: hypothetical protein Q8K65_05040 [Alphaproteobacteria bacterium]|nr:hypothetical protein [Alphaproteobacteria bacterium]
MTWAFRFAFTEKAQKKIFFNAALGSQSESDHALEVAFLKAFHGSNLTPLRHFMSGIVTFKRASGETKKDDMYDKYVVNPFLALMETSDKPAVLAATVVGGLPKEISQTILDFSLRAASSERSPAIAAALLDAGADVNTNGSHPLFNAVVRERSEMIALLDAHGADWEAKPGYFISDNPSVQSEYAEYAQMRAEAKAALTASFAVAAPTPVPPAATCEEVHVLPTLNVRRRPAAVNVP